MRICIECRKPITKVTRTADQINRKLRGDDSLTRGKMRAAKSPLFFFVCVWLVERLTRDRKLPITELSKTKPFGVLDQFTKKAKMFAWGVLQIQNFKKNFILMGENPRTQLLEKAWVGGEGRGGEIAIGTWGQPHHSFILNHSLIIKYIYRYIFFEKKPCISLFVFLDRNRSSFLFKSLDL